MRLPVPSRPQVRHPSLLRRQTQAHLEPCNGLESMNPVQNLVKRTAWCPWHRLHMSNTSTIQILMEKGANIFRIPIKMECLAQGTTTSALDATYLSGLSTVVSYITKAGGHAVMDAQNFGRHDGTVFTSAGDFKHSGQMLQRSSSLTVTSSSTATMSSMMNRPTNWLWI